MSELKNGRYEEFNRSVWYEKGLIHREDGPAVEHFDRWFKKWYRHGILHREDGPAVECLNGNSEWYFDGRLHREDGPAVVLSDGSEEWWINGNEFTKKEFNQFLEKKALNERLQELPHKHTVKRSKI